MRMLGTVGQHQVIVLVDMGSPHNFMRQAVAEYLQLTLEGKQWIKVKVASGTHLQTLDMCPPIPLVLQNHTFTMAFQVLPLNDYDIVVGTKWLKEFRDISWNFKELEMNFTWEGKPVTLKGLQTPITTVISGKRLCKGLNSNQFATMFHICEEKHLLEISQLNSEKLLKLNQLLQDYQELFEEPKGLPPHRSCDHQIILKDENQLCKHTIRRR